MASTTTPFKKQALGFDFISYVLVLISVFQGVLIITGFSNVKIFIFFIEFTLLIILFYYLTLNLIINKQFRTNYKIVILTVAVLTIFLFWIFLWDSFNLSDFIKILSYVLILSSSYTMSFRQESNNHTGLYLLILIPLAFLALDFLINFNEHAGIFTNRSVASYHIVVTSIVLLQFSKKKYFVAYLTLLLPLAKLGAIIWLVIASIINNLKLLIRIKFIFLFVFISFITVFFYYLFYDEIYVFQRLNFAVSKILILGSTFTFSQLSSLTWDELISYFITSGDSYDKFSFLFRIYHWTEIVNIYLDSPLSEMLFGHGFRSIPEMTYFKLVAHNDYLGLLFETGLLFFAIFVYSQICFLRAIRKSKSFVIFLSISLFFLSENLYYNFLTTSLYYMLMGYIWALENKKKKNEAKKDS